MGIEIERRFLVENEDWKDQIILSESFSQAYLNSSVDEWATRVRIIDNKEGYITLKSSLNGLTNYEFEYSIPKKDAIELIQLSKYKITKTRYQLKINKKNWVVDVFEESNSCLRIAEIELNSETQQILLPDWVGKEVTGIVSFYNSQLSKFTDSEVTDLISAY